MPLGKDELANRYGWHPPTTGPKGTALTHKAVREAFEGFANYLNHALPDGRYAELAQTDLEEASMWTNKAIASQAPLAQDGRRSTGDDWD